MTGPAKLFELPEILEFHEVKDAFTRTVMILMAVATLAGGVVEFLHSRAAVQGDHAGREAHQFGIQAMAALVRADHTAQAEYEKFALAAEERTRRWNTLQEKYLPLINRLPANSRPADLEIARLSGLAKRMEQLSEIAPDGRYAPAQDPTFPDRFFASKQFAYWTVWARQDAANEEFVAWKKQQSHYTTVLTLYAAALYLFGLSLAIQRPIRRQLAYVAAALVAIGSGAAVWAVLTSPAQMSEAAAGAYATDYAAGKQAFATAHERAGYELAKQHFTKAINLRKTFAQAYQDRAAASFEAGAPQHVGLPGVTDLASLQAAEEDERAALRLGLRNSDLLLSHGNNLLLLALEGDPSQAPARLRASVADTRQAIELDPGYPLPYYTLAAAYLANQDFARARETFTRAVKLTLAKEDGDIKFTRAHQQRFVSAALTNLESVLRSRAKLVTATVLPDTLVCEVQAMKVFIVGSVAMNQPQAMPAPGKCSPARPTYDAHAVVLPVGLVWWAKLGRFDSHRDFVSFQWYYRDPVLQRWMALPNVSLLRTATIGKVSTRPEIFYERTTYLIATAPPTCVPGGEFRVDLYVRGQYAGSGIQKTPPSFAGMSAVMRRDLNAAFCVPKAWRVDRAPSGFMAEYRNPNRTQGMVFIRFHYPRPAMDSAVAKERVVARYVTLLLERMLRFPAGHYQKIPVPKGFFSLNFQFVQRSAYRAGNQEVVMQSGVADDGAIVIGFVYGPRAYIERDREAKDIFTSLIVFGKHGPDYYGLNGTEGSEELE
jgi:tetratricopeptide (TPR) repeat protein